MTEHKTEKGQTVGLEMQPISSPLKAIDDAAKEVVPEAINELKEHVKSEVMNQRVWMLNLLKDLRDRIKKDMEELENEQKTGRFVPFLRKQAAETELKSSRALLDKVNVWIKDFSSIDTNVTDLNGVLKLINDNGTLFEKVAADEMLKKSKYNGFEIMGREFAELPKFLMRNKALFSGMFVLAAGIGYGAAVAMSGGLALVPMIPVIVSTIVSLGLLVGEKIKRIQKGLETIEAPITTEAAKLRFYNRFHYDYEQVKGVTSGLRNKVQDQLPKQEEQSRPSVGPK